MAKIKSFPNNADVYVGAESVMRWLHGRTSGVFAANGNAATVAVDGAMAVQVSDGSGWISNNNNDGVVWWIDTEAETGKKLLLDVPTAHGALNRIDRVIIEWQTTTYADLPEVKILKGTESAYPTAPALTNDGTVRQISIAAISVPAGTTAITSGMITDERLNPEVCGLVTDGIEIDTTVINNQFEDLIAQLRTMISQAASSEIVDNSIVTSKIADGAVTPEKLSEEYVPASGGTFSGDVTFSQNINADGVVAPSDIFSVNSHLLAGHQIFLTESCYGTTLPSGEHYTGRIFFKKV